jgi:hypothetical protein
MGYTNFPYGITSFGVPIVGMGQAPIIPTNGQYWFVDGTSGSDSFEGNSPDRAFATIAKGLAVAGKGDAVFVFPKEMSATSTDAVSYAETVTMAVPHVSLIGVSRGLTQGGLPQISKGSGAVALITVSAPGCLIMNMGINGLSSTGGGILLNDDGGATSSALGTTIYGCHFKNCVGSTATNAATGGAIQWAATGGGWQVRIQNNRFYKNVGDIVLKGTSGSVPQDVIIEGNVFSGPAANVDCNLYLAAGSGMNGVIIRDNHFTCFPAIGSGTNAKQLALTGCVGQLSDNYFATSGKTFGAAGNNLVPTTVFMNGNFQEITAGANATGEVGRT